MLNYIYHDHKETLYIAVSLIDFYKAVAESDDKINKIKFSDITNYLI